MWTADITRVAQAFAKLDKQELAILFNAAELLKRMMETKSTGIMKETKRQG